MKLPNGDRAAIDERKLREYLLSESHPVGRFKARFFGRLGFGADAWQSLEEALRSIAPNQDVAESETTEYGRKYIISGMLTGPTGGSAEVDGLVHPGGG